MLTGIISPKKTFLVQNGISTKILQLTETLDVKIREVFDIAPEKKIIKQYFNKEWDSFIDIDDVNCLENNSRLRVILSVSQDNCESTLSKNCESNPFPEGTSVDASWPDKPLEASTFSIDFQQALKNNESLNWRCKNQLIQNIQDHIFANTLYPKAEHIQQKLSKTIP
ncbi:hypothetical protein SNE40_015759 [Patella caerulea]|uniref:Uncharacterized protein n=1 Tax=Patella caerulea TaxID=87958 RepID=A0AAN8JHP9_PATCE